MKHFSFDWIHPLQERVKKTLPQERSSFFKAWSIIMPILLYYAVNTLCMMIITYAVLWIRTQNGGDNSAAQWILAHPMLISGLGTGIAMLIALFSVYKDFLKEAPQIQIGASHTKEIPLLFILGASAALCFNILFELIQITGSSDQYQEVARQQFSLPLWAGIVLYGVISPIAEEVVFRGIVYNRLHRQFGRGIALFGSALLFGAYHGNVVQAAYGFILGLLIAVLYERYGAFTVPVLIHSAANICVYIMASNTELQERLVNWSGVCITGVLAILLFWLLVLRKVKNTDQ